MMPAAAVLLLFLIVLGVTLPFIRSAEHEVLTLKRCARAPGFWVGADRGLRASSLIGVEQEAT